MAACTIKFEFELSSNASFLAPKVAVWLDHDANDLLNEDEQLTAAASEAAPLKFVAESKLLDEDKTRGVLFYIKYLAAVGAEWTLTVTKQVGEHDEVLLHDSGPVGYRPSFIAGRLRK